MIYSKKKKQKCPSCGSAIRIQINTGYPDYSGCGCTNSKCYYFKHIPQSAFKQKGIDDFNK